MNRWACGCLVVVLVVLCWSASPAWAVSPSLSWQAVHTSSTAVVCGAGGESSRRPPPRANPTDPGATPDVRERLVGGRFKLQKELETDRSWDTWLYVFSAVMLLCVGWLCFKPYRVYAGKSGGGLTLFRKKGDKGRKGKK